MNCNDQLNDDKIDIMAAKIRWQYKDSPEYNGMVDSLLQKGQEEIVFPFFEIKKPRQKKRHISSLELNKNRKK